MLNFKQNFKAMKKAIPFFMLPLFLISCSTDADSNEPIVNGDSDIVKEVTISIPDEAFEQALIDLNLDNELNGEVNKSNIDFVTELLLNDKGISDLTGIAEFPNLESLNVRNNSLTTIDVSDNVNLLFIWVEDNQLENINVDGLRSLEKIGADRNSLENINVTTNTALQLLTVSENGLTGIDLTSNSSLTDFNIVNNPLNCILVNQMQLDEIPTDWVKDEEDSYALDCQ